MDFFMYKNYCEYIFCINYVFLKYMDYVRFFFYFIILVYNLIWCVFCKKLCVFMWLLMVYVLYICILVK